ncbi:MAG TPA: hypothetical protein VLG13_02395 [Patescibacteria group bacterium]|nr:hypothetical protein [Patescibacteria group bacterium]
MTERYIPREAEDGPPVDEVTPRVELWEEGSTVEGQPADVALAADIAVLPQPEFRHPRLAKFLGRFFWTVSTSGTAKSSGKYSDIFQDRKS